VKVAAADEQARTRAVEKAQESIDEMNDRHLRTVPAHPEEGARSVYVRRRSATRWTPVRALSTSRARRAADPWSSRLDRSAVNVEEIIKREYEPVDGARRRGEGNEWGARSRQAEARRWLDKGALFEDLGYKPHEGAASNS